MKEDLSQYMIPDPNGRYETQWMQHDAVRKEVDHNRYYLKTLYGWTNEEKFNFFHMYYKNFPS